jgi:hypothetical protein
MGFELDAYLVLDDLALATYEALYPGVLRHAVVASSNATTSVPVGYVLPVPGELAGDDAWAGFPGELIQEHMERAGLQPARLIKGLNTSELCWFDLDYSVAWLMSIMSERGAALILENVEQCAMCWQHGELCFAQGLGYHSGALIHWQSGEHLERFGEIKDSFDPISHALTTMDERFKSVFLFDGYLPRDMHMPMWRPREWTRPLPRVSREQVLAAATNWLEQHPE